MCFGKFFSWERTEVDIKNNAHFMCRNERDICFCVTVYSVLYSFDYYFAFIIEKYWKINEEFPFIIMCKKCRNSIDSLKGNVKFYS